MHDFEYPHTHKTKLHCNRIFLIRLLELLIIIKESHIVCCNKSVLNVCVCVIKNELNAEDAKKILSPNQMNCTKKVSWGIISNVEHILSLFISHITSYKVLTAGDVIECVVYGKV